MTFSDLVATHRGAVAPKRGVFVLVFSSLLSASGVQAVDVTAQLQETAGCYLTAVVVLPVLEDLRLQQVVLFSLDAGKLVVRH